MIKAWFFFTLILFSAFPVCAGGGGEAVPEAHKNAEWVLAVTALDVSALPAARQGLGSVLLRTLLESLRGLERRVRSDGEIAYYGNHELSRARNEAANALAAKQNERSLLLYRGDPEWKYSQSLRTIDSQILELEEAYRSLETAAPLIDPHPLLKIPAAAEGIPGLKAPAQGGEYLFCTGEKADAFLAGRVSEYYGRVYLTLKLYTLYSRSYVWEDGVLFSPQDMDSALSELSARLAAVLSGEAPAALMVHVEPKEAAVLVDGFWAGRGEVSLREHAPGNVTVESYSESHVPITYALEISSGEITELFFNLTPLGRASLTVDVPDSLGSSVYYGGLFMGNTPLTLELPRDGLSFISVETPEGETGSVVHRTPVRGSAEFIRSETLTLDTSVPVAPEEKRVAAARDDFYSAYGRLWIGLPVSLLAVGMAENYIKAYSSKRSPNLYAPAQTGAYVRIGAYVIIGLVAAETVYRIVRYLITSGADADPIARRQITVPEDQ